MRGLLGCVALAMTAGWSCGDISSAQAPGDALYTVSGRLASGVFEAPEGNYRSVLIWLSIGGGPFVECLETGLPADCIASSSDHEATMLVEAARVKPIFPSRFTLDIVSLPDRDHILDYKDSVLAFGSVSIYDDRNDNGRLDLAEDVGPDEADRLVATSSTTMVPSLVVYREGPVHPGWSILRAFGCGDPPLGFSMVIDPVGFGCTVQPLADLVVRAITEDASARTLCAGRAGRLVDRFDAVPRWEFALNPNAVVDCDASGEAFTFYIDRGNLCDAYFERSLALRGCPSGVEDGGEGCWDRTASPPEWWPCALE